MKNAPEIHGNIIGDWVLTEVTTRGVTEKCNVCPTIIFLEGKSGKLIKPSKEEFDFTFEIQTDSIMFSEINSPLFYDRLFSYKIIDKGKLLTLELQSSKSKLVLSRSKE